MINTKDNQPAHQDVKTDLDHAEWGLECADNELESVLKQAAGVFTLEQVAVLEVLSSAVQGKSSAIQHWLRVHNENWRSRQTRVDALDEHISRRFDDSGMRL